MAKEVKRWPVDRPILTTVCEPVIEGVNCRHLIAEMRLAMNYPKGVGLAANQLGEDKRIIVLKWRDWEQAIINPEIFWRHKSRDVLGPEACLSFPGRSVMVKRNRHVKVRGFDEHWNPIVIGGKDIRARILQHEIDHLDGITMLDRQWRKNDELVDTDN